MVSGTRDNPPPKPTLSSVCMCKRFPHRPSQSYWIIKCKDVPFSLSFPWSFDHSGLNFHFFDTNFCFKSWHSLRQEISQLGEPKCSYEEKLSRLPARSRSSFITKSCSPVGNGDIALPHTSFYGTLTDTKGSGHIGYGDFIIDKI